MGNLDNYLVEESLTNMTYRRRYMFENGLGVMLLESIYDNDGANKTWNCFVVKQEEYDPEQGQDYSFVFDLIDESRMRNIDIEDAMKIIEEVMNYEVK